MVQNHIHHQVHAALGSLPYQLVKVLHSSVSGVNISVIRDIVSVVILRRGKKRSDPQIVHTQLCQIIQMLNYASQISETVSVCILKRLGINLIYYFSA